MKNRIKFYLTFWIVLFTFLNVNAQCETIMSFFKNDMYTSKELVTFAENNPQSAFDSWKLLYNEKTGLTRSVEELTLVSKNLDEISKAGGYTKWKSLKESGNLFKVIEEDGYAVIRGVNNEFVARAWLGFDNEFNLTIITKGTSLEGKGRAVFQSLFNFIDKEYDEILKIRGTWRSSDNVADNLNTFNDFIKGGMSANEAALKTFTGKMAIEHQFINAQVLPTSIIGPDGTYSSVDVLFTK